MKQKLPIGTSDFKILRRENYVYVDKTLFIEKLLNTGRFFFLSRPRRFGKTLFLSTLYYFFRGEKDLFKGLYIYERWKWEKYPVIRLSMTATTPFDKEAFILSLNELLRGVFDAYGLQRYYNAKFPPSINFRNLIEHLSRKENSSVVVLIDEYDVPLTDNLLNPKVFHEVRNFLRQFYRVLKDNDHYIAFLFVTGVTKFAHVSLFSGFNNLEDISLTEEFATICGYTEKEFLHYFKDYLPENPQQLRQNLQIIRQWYNGYDFYGYDKKNSQVTYEQHRTQNCVYNPYDILLYLRQKTFDVYWFTTATPSFLIEFAQKHHLNIPIASLEKMQISTSVLRTYELQRISLVALMFQTGYLTLDKRLQLPDHSVAFTLRIPNHEVRIALAEYLLLHYFQLPFESVSLPTAYEIKENLAKGAIERFLNFLHSLYAALPYETKGKIFHYEDFHRDLLFTILWLLDIAPVAEDISIRGRADLSFVVGNNAYVIEFKVNGEKLSKGIEQIKSKGYHQKYLGRCGKVFLISLTFDRQRRQLQAVYEQISV